MFGRSNSVTIFGISILSIIILSGLGFAMPNAFAADLAPGNTPTDQNGVNPVSITEEGDGVVVQVVWSDTAADDRAGWNVLAPDMKHWGERDTGLLTNVHQQRKARLPLQRAIVIPRVGGANR